MIIVILYLYTYITILHGTFGTPTHISPIDDTKIRIRLCPDSVR